MVVSHAPKHHHSWEHALQYLDYRMHLWYMDVRVRGIAGGRAE